MYRFKFVFKKWKECPSNSIKEMILQMQSVLILLDIKNPNWHCAMGKSELSCSKETI